MKMRVADIIMKEVADYGIKHVFLVTGGGAMHLNDAIAIEKRLTPIFNHHEQACSIAAEGYSRISNDVSFINVTTGPGGLNALNGVFGAYTDSIPMLIVSGQVKRQTKKSSVPDLNLRQLGDQEVDIVNVVKPITKYVVSLENPEDVKYEIQKALYLAREGRPGPVWIDVPVDVQGTLVEESELRAFDKASEIKNVKSTELEVNISLLIEKLKAAKRPVVLVGNGVRLSNNVKNLLTLLDILQIPLCSAWMMDFIPNDYKYFCGIQGTIGDRAGNFVVQNSDFLLILGSRLQIRQVSYNWENFAREAYKVHVDIDLGELNKPTLNTDLKINSDLSIFFQELLKQLEIQKYEVSKTHLEWLNWAKSRKNKYNPVVEQRHRQKSKLINPYAFFEILSQKLDSNWNLVAANASACVMSFPTIQLKEGQRAFTNAGSASMGYDLPAAIGASIADPSRKTLCIAGDGSIMMNIQELQTIVQHKLNIKILILNNDGYLSIRSTQKGFFGRQIGEGSESGITLPDFEKVGNAFGINTISIKSYFELETNLDSFLNSDQSMILNLYVDPSQPFEPKLSSKKMDDGKMVTAPLEDMWPFLDREEFKENMIVNTLEVSR